MCFEICHKIQNMKAPNKTVLITGATSGIGLALARLFARDLFSMVIVSRDWEKLRQTADILREEGAIGVVPISKDLSKPGSAWEIYNYTKNRGILVNMLVNNAGVGEYGTFEQNDIDKELAIIQLNITSMVQLTKFYLNDMLATNGGRILQLGSIAAYQPTPKLAVYAATKAFILSFSDALGTELKGSKVSVTTLIPGATHTDFFRKAGMEHTKAANEGLEDPTVVARLGYEALMRGDAHAFAPGVMRSAIMSSVLPNRTVAGLAEKDMQDAGDEKAGNEPDKDKKQDKKL